MAGTYDLHPIGVVRSPLRSPREAPRQAFEGAPPARLEILPEFRDALDGIAAGDEVVVLTWLDRASRDVRHVHPRGDHSLPLTGVFATRSPGRPNPDRPPPGHRDRDRGRHRRGRRARGDRRDARRRYQAGHGRVGRRMNPFAPLGDDCVSIWNGAANAEVRAAAAAMRPPRVFVGIVIAAGGIVAPPPPPRCAVFFRDPGGDGAEPAMVTILATPDGTRFDLAGARRYEGADNTSLGRALEAVMADDGTLSLLDAPQPFPDERAE